MGIIYYADWIYRLPATHPYFWVGLPI